MVLVVSLFASEFLRYGVEKIVWRRDPPRCTGETCGKSGWTLVRKDADSCPVLCVKCGWVSHFDIKQWHELNGSGSQKALFWTQELRNPARYTHVDSDGMCSVVGNLGPHS
jgi:hypothetical protein